MAKEEKKRCCKCKLFIPENSKYCEIITHFDKTSSHTDYFHFRCWVDYFNECMQKRLKGVQNKMFGLAKGLMEKIMS
jgi:hypothetical protein